MSHVVKPVREQPRRGLRRHRRIQRNHRDHRQHADRIAA